MADPTALYSYKGESPTTLPHKIKPAEGVVRTDVSTFTDKEISDAGFTGPYEVPTHNQKTQRVHWNSEKLSYSVVDITDEELWVEIRKERNKLLEECDWTMTADVSRDVNQKEWEMHRQRLRDITTIFSNPREVDWPRSPEGRADDDFDQPRVIEDKLRWRVSDLEQQVDALYKKVFPDGDPSEGK
tara:strand:- start:8299 stop:8856 length:558 start_codon:yes stop_codon:yes gene_type:complete